MAAQPGDQTTRLWIGAGNRGRTLRTTLETIAKEEGKSLSRLLLEAAIEKHCIDPVTGRRKHT